MVVVICKFAVRAVHVADAQSMDVQDQAVPVAISLMRLQTYKPWGPVVRNPISHP